MWNKIVVVWGAGRGLWATIPAPGRGGVLMILAGGLLTAMHSVVRYLSSEMHPFEIAFFRNVFWFLALSPLFIRYGLELLRVRQPKLQALRGVTGIIAMLCWFSGLSVVPLTEATALSFTNTIFGSIIAAIFLKEHLSRRRLGAIFFGFLGILVIVRPGLIEWNSGTFLVLVAAFCWGGSVVVIKELSRTDTSASIVAWFGIQLSVMSFPFAIMVWSWPVITDYFWLALMGLLGTLGHLAMTRALKLMDSTAVFPLEFIRLLWAALFGYVFFSELPDVWTWLGAAIIVISTLSFLRREARGSSGEKFENE